MILPTNVLFAHVDGQVHVVLLANGYSSPVAVVGLCAVELLRADQLLALQSGGSRGANRPVHCELRRFRHNDADSTGALLCIRLKLILLMTVIKCKSTNSIFYVCNSGNTKYVIIHRYGTVNASYYTIDFLDRDSCFYKGSVFSCWFILFMNKTFIMWMFFSWNVKFFYS